MSTPLTAVEFTFKFNLKREGTLEDIAEFSVWAHEDSFEPDDDSLLKLARGAYNAWDDNVSPTHWCNNVSLSTVTGRCFLANGHTLREQIYAADTPWTGTAADPAMPWETALVLSLYTYERGTFIVNGKRKRGRIYLPPMAASNLENSNSGYFSNSNLPGFFSSLVNFIGRVGQDDLGVKVIHPGVFSRVDGVMRDIVQLSIDAKFDSQRRRQNREIAGILGANYHE